MVESEPSSWILLGKTAMALGIVIAMILAIAYLAKRFMKPERWGIQAAGRIKILQSFSLAPKKKLMIVEVDSQRLLLGLSESSISMLTNLPASSSASNVQISDAADAAEARHAIF